MDTAEVISWTGYLTRGRQYYMISTTEIKGRRRTMSFIQEAICRRCGYRWTPKTEHPRRCPACKRADWGVGQYDTNNTHRGLIQVVLLFDRELWGEFKAEAARAHISVCRYAELALHQFIKS